MKVSEEHNKLKSVYKNSLFDNPDEGVTYTVSDGEGNYFITKWENGVWANLDFIKFGRDKYVFYKELELMDNRKEMLKDYIDYAIDNKLNGKW